MNLMQTVVTYAFILFILIVLGKQMWTEIYKFLYLKKKPTSSVEPKEKVIEAKWTER